MLPFHAQIQGIGCTQPHMLGSPAHQACNEVDNIQELHIKVKQGKPVYQQVHEQTD
jgi:hypothetical protein